ncbi:MAG: T9SS type A sorting domain-containing protein [Bacteroidales bacterium]|nr:T9SS type A sorting domain-containing protein [Bacteroidales bacterium]MDD4001871.1 T9SS type A sorting domain-containing protein [Bacteroidales bacterium]MDD4528660.1 T9SS type A sorting domain-containing protein [Bacteroidales bacterium]MDD4829108.1 T9SS type A sorting domain-containing protein [Bacteroidales bacterium]
MKKYFLIIVLIFSLSFSSKLHAQLPVINMVTTTDTVTYWGARMIAFVTTKGGWTVNSYGFIFDTLPMPTRATGAKILRVGTTNCPENNSYTGTVNSSSSFMASDKTYYVRAYVAKTSGGNDTVFSNPMSVTTLSPNPPQCLMDSIYDIGLTYARFAGVVAAKKDANAIYSKGFVYSYLSNNPILGNAINVPSGGGVSTFPFSFLGYQNNLISGNKYYVRNYLIYRYLNKTTNDTIYSDTISFKTLHACGTIPSNVQVDSVTQTTARLTFIPGLAQTKWEVDYGFAGHLIGTGTTIMATNDTVDLVGLIGGVSYTIYVRAVCDTVYGDWTGDYTFTTVPPLCAPVTNISVSNFTHSSADISWMPGSPTQNKWEVLFAESSDNFPTIGIIKEGRPPVFNPIGLIPRTEYKLQIRALCSEHTSDWSAVYYFNTLPRDLQDEIENGIEKVLIYPNPTNGTINFKAKEINNFTKIEIYTSLGELIYYSDNLPEFYTLENQVKGLYLVKIYSKNYVQVEKVVLN